MMIAPCPLRAGWDGPEPVRGARVEIGAWGSADTTTTGTARGHCATNCWKSTGPAWTGPRRG
jgi:hypothetical protein